MKLHVMEHETLVIRTNHDFPPIPVRSMDWSAVVDGNEETGPYGRGATEQAAIDDLLEQLEDDA